MPFARLPIPVNRRKPGLVYVGETDLRPGIRTVEQRTGPPMYRSDLTPKDINRNWIKCYLSTKSGHIPASSLPCKSDLLSYKSG